MSLKVGIVGAAGYAGAELIRLVLGHPDFELTAITSNADAGQPLSAVYPSFTGVSDLVFTTHDAPELKNCDAVFLAVPHTAAMAQVPALLAAGVSCFDLSADYRLSDPAVFETWYAAEHTSPELLRTRAFGLPELFCQDLETAASDHADGKPVLRSLKKYHGKPGSGASVEFKLKEGPITMLGITQTGENKFKFIIGEGYSEKGPIPPTGNTNTRGRFEPNTKNFIKRWVMAGPTHHYALGLGHKADTIAKIADILGIEYEIVR